MDFTEIFKCDALAAVLASAAVTVAAIVIAKISHLLFLMAPDGGLSGVSTLAPPGQLSACDLDVILFGICY